MRYQEKERDQESLEPRGQVRKEGDEGQETTARSLSVRAKWPVGAGSGKTGLFFFFF